MRTIKPLLVFVAILLLSGFSREWEPQTIYKPRLLLRDDLEKSIFTQSPRQFDYPGKIYLYGTNIYIIDKYSGVHVIDNQDPHNPAKSGFIHIPGIMDMAIRDSVMYVDNSVDLVGVDIRQYPEISVTSRLINTFPEPTPPDLEWIPNKYSKEQRPQNTVIVGWFK